MSNRTSLASECAHTLHSTENATLEQELMHGTCLELSRTGQSENLVKFGHFRHKRLLDEDMTPGVECLACERHMTVEAGADVDHPHTGTLLKGGRQSPIGRRSTHACRQMHSSGVLAVYDGSHRSTCADRGLHVPTTHQAGADHHCLYGSP